MLESQKGYDKLSEVFLNLPFNVHLYKKKLSWISKLYAEEQQVKRS